MKKFICTFIFLVTINYCYAQRTVDYISFFPPSNVVHSDVTLTQNNQSFNYDGLVSEGTDYAGKPGGIILGGTENSTVTIKSMNVVLGTGSKAYAINNFKIENIIKISSQGLIKNINIGEICNLSYNSCNRILISANSVSLPYRTTYPTNIQMNIEVSDTTTMDSPFSTQPTNFLPPLTEGNDKLKWVKLRIKGTEECRPYLAAYKGDAPADNCAEPS